MAVHGGPPTPEDDTRLTMCPLPPKYWWEVRLIQRLDSVHLHLYEGKREQRTCAVLDFSKSDIDWVVRRIVDESYIMWEKFYRSSYKKDDVWKKRGVELQKRLASPGAEVKVRVEHQ